MGILKVDSVSESSKEKESLHIKKGGNGKKSKITCTIYQFKFKDKDTKQIVYVIPSLGLSGYGETDSKALEMIKFELDSYFEYLIKLPSKLMNKELMSLGWIHNKFKIKDFSKSYVDIHGHLTDFNIENEVEEELLSL